MINQRDVSGQIVETAMELFYKFGFHKVSVDEIAGKLRISKKTFYKHYQNKEMLVLKIVEKSVQDLDRQIGELVSARNMNVKEKLEKFLAIVTSFHLTLSQNFLHDCLRYIPRLVHHLEISIDHIITNNFKILFQNGVEEHVFRDDIDPGVFVTLYSHIVQKLHDPDLLANVSYSFQDLHQMVMKLLFEGILTPEVRHQ